MKFFDAHNIFPEYFVISVPLFNDVIKDELDEWLYMMKHSEVKEDFKSPYMKKVADRLSVLKMTPAERKEYTAYRNESLKERDYIVSAEEKGIEIGKAEGKAEENIRVKIEIAKAMLLDGDSAEKIAKITGLSILEIEKLKS
jgi:predicted transposase/invertase (TIGR01784 family)